MRQSTDLGMNRTGMDMAAQQGKRMLENVPAATGLQTDGEALRQAHKAYLETSPPIGNTPPLASMKGALKTGIEMLKGHKPTVLVDKLGERLAFERTGVRLYEALLMKLESDGSWPGGPSRETLEEFCEQERRHFEMLHECIESMGGDPTAMTPSADIAGVASEGVVKVITDPRSSLKESLEALLIAELVDHDGWEMLIGIAGGLGENNWVQAFQDAHQEEERHLQTVRNWLTKGLEQEAGAA